MTREASNSSANFADYAEGIEDQYISRGHRARAMETKMLLTQGDALGYFLAPFQGFDSLPAGEQV